jgi:hypothetical protein
MAAVLEITRYDHERPPSTAEVECHATVIDEAQQWGYGVKWSDNELGILLAALLGSRMNRNHITYVAGPPEDPVAVLVGTRPELSRPGFNFVARLAFGAAVRGGQIGAFDATELLMDTFLKEDADPRAPTHTDALPETPEYDALCMYGFIPSSSIRPRARTVGGVPIITEQRLTYQGSGGSTAYEI